MSHSSAHICAEHKAVQLQCRCPEPDTPVIEEECKHGELTEHSLFWNGTKIVHGSELTVQAVPDTVTILRSDLAGQPTEKEDGHED